MGQFKPMVKMETTEPSVMLKLKKGGHVAMPKGADGHKSMSKMADGGMAMPMPRRPARAMAAARPMIPARPMKEGGESKAEHKAEMKALKGIKSELKSHEGKPASKAHKGLKTGGVVMNQGGYAKGGGVTGNVSSAKPGATNTKTGDVRLGNAGGFKKGGAAKKAYATGGKVDTGRPVAMPQGNKKPSPPVAIDRLAGIFKTGGGVEAGAKPSPMLKDVYKSATTGDKKTMAGFKRGGKC